MNFVRARYFSVKPFPSMGEGWGVSRRANRDIEKHPVDGEGDPVRREGMIRDGLSRYFAAFNRNKRFLTLNLKHEEGREVLAKLIAGSGVLVENFQPGVLARFGFDEAGLYAGGNRAPEAK